MTGHTKWSVINTTLYAMCFTGLAATQARCELCLATTHTVQECTQSGDRDPGTKERLKTIESVMVALVKKGDPPKPPVYCRTKTDRFWKGVSIYIGRTGCPLCPVAAILSYMVKRGSSGGPLSASRMAST